MITDGAISNGEIFPGDVVLTASNSWLGRFIRWGERSWGEAPSEYNHVAIAVAPGYALDVSIVEALGRGVQRTWLRQTHERDRVAVWSPLNISDKEREIVERYALSRVGRWYGYGQILGQLLDHKILPPRTDGRARLFFRRIFRLSPLDICSEVASRAYSTIGRDFGVKAYSATPDDIADFVSTHPQFYTRVYYQDAL